MKLSFPNYGVNSDDRGNRSDEPFFAVCSYPDTHHPFSPPGRYYDIYDPADVAVPARFDDPQERSTPQYKRMRKRRGQPLKAHVNPFSPIEPEFREMAAKAYGMISIVDDAVGRLLATLEESGLADNTIIVFISDHGDMFGDHGMMLKPAMHYDGCIRVPLLIKTPGKVAGVSNSLVGSIDLAATISAMAGVEPHHGMQSHDLTPLLDDPTLTPRDSILIEEDQVHDMVHTGRPLRMRTLLTNEARLTLYDGQEHGELFDRVSDPEEMRNLYGLQEGAVLQAEMTNRLTREMMSNSDISPRPTAFA